MTGGRALGLDSSAPLDVSLTRLQATRQLEKSKINQNINKINN
jgi:hypothetical protein